MLFLYRRVRRANWHSSFCTGHSERPNISYERRGYKYRITTSCTYFFTLDGALILYLDARVDSEGLDQLGEGGAAASLLVESPTQLPHRKPVNPATEALR